MTLAYAAVLGLHICFIDVKAQKIDKSIFLTHNMVLANFLLKDKLERLRFFEKSFLVTNTVIEVVLEMLFLAVISSTQ